MSQPVSYTHLDVYKRQGMAWFEHRKARQPGTEQTAPPHPHGGPGLPLLTLVWVCIQGAFGALTVTMKPVSYTHLDVYKRQGFQVYEYMHAYSELGLTLGAGVYGATFFILTGFHGMHVTLGAIMLAVMLGRSMKGHFSEHNHFAFEAVAWYWHFVDVVWLVVFVFVYWL